MKESTTYQAIIAEGEAQGRAEGRVEGVRDVLLYLGSKRLGLPGVRIQAELEAITDLDSLQQLIDRLESVSSWDELLTTRHRGRRRKKG
jgi:predicted transposase YdaD